MLSVRSLANLKSVNCSVRVFILDLSASDSALRLCKSSCVAVKLFSSSVMTDSFDCSNFIFLRSCCRIFSARSLANLKSVNCPVRLSALDLYPSNSSLRPCNSCCFPAHAIFQLFNAGIFFLEQLSVSLKSLPQHAFDICLRRPHLAGSELRRRYLGRLQFD